MIARVFGPLALALLLAGCAITRDGPRTLDARDLALLDTAFAAKVETGERAGYVIAVSRDGGQPHVAALGVRDVDTDVPMTPDTLFRIASMSKPVTAVAVMQLVEKGVIGLDDPVADYVPSVGNMAVATSLVAAADWSFPTTPQTAPMTIRHLLTHTSGLGYIFEAETDLGKRYAGATLYSGYGDLAEKIDQLGALPLYFQPGDRWFYSWSSDVLGRVVEVASGVAFQDYLQANVFDPLGMTDTTFFPTEAQRARLASVHTRDASGALVAAKGFSATADTAAYEPTWASGGGGLVSLAGDYLAFAQMLANGGTLNGARILKPETVAEMIRPQTGEADMPKDFAGRGYGFGLGMVTDPSVTPVKDRFGDFGWPGYYDTDFFVSPRTGVVAVVMSQNLRGPHSRDVDTGGDFRAAVFKATR